MPNPDPTAPEIRITRHFGAPLAAVFAEWLNADALQDWFAPDPFTGQSAAADPRPGGAWSVDYQAPDGTRFRESGSYIEIVPHSRLMMTLTQSLLPGLMLTIEVTFAPHQGGTLMTFRQTGFGGTDLRDGMELGWSGCLDKLAQRLADPSAEISVAI